MNGVRSSAKHLCIGERCRWIGHVAAPRTPKKQYVTVSQRRRRVASSSGCHTGRHLKGQCSRTKKLDELWIKRTSIIRITVGAVPAAGYQHIPAWQQGLGVIGPSRNHIPNSVESIRQGIVKPCTTRV